ncbi:MAG: adenylate/guanylate cyclase domain-containing protein [Fibrobacterota bacterium]
MKKSVYILFLLILQAKAAFIHTGEMDLRYTHIDSTFITRLDGNWQFYWNRLISPQQIQNEPTDGLFYIPGFWNSRRIDGEPAGPHGSATFYLTVLLPPHHPASLGLKTNTQNTAFSLWVNGELVQKNGTPALTKEAYVPRYLPKTSIFSVRSDTLHVVLHVSNYIDAKGGPWKSLLLGTPQMIVHRRQSHLQMQLFYFGAILIIGIIFFTLYLFGNKKKSRYELFFSLFCFLIALRISLTGERFLIDLFSDLSWHVFLRLEYYTFYLMILLYSFYLYYLFPKDFSRKVLFGILYISGSFVFLCTVSPPSVYSRTVSIYQMYILLVIMYQTFVIIRALHNKRNGARGIFVGTLFIYIAAINDILYNNVIINTGEMLSAGVFMMILCQAVILAMMFSKTKKEAEDLRDNLSRTNHSLTRFIPYEVFRLLNKKSVIDISLGDQVLENMSVMFVKIRWKLHSHSSDRIHRNFTDINRYLRYICPVIETNMGFVDKYFGDGIMALFPRTEKDAVIAATELIRAVNGFNRYNQSNQIEAGIGVHSGRLILGTVGNEKRMDTTVISDAVNLASRLENVTRVYGAGILVTHNVLERAAVREQLNFRLIDTVTVKGKNLPSTIYEILDGLPVEEFLRKKRTASSFKEGIEEYLAGNMQKAFSIFSDILSLNPADEACHLYAERSKHYLQYGTPQNWSGVTRLT